MAAGGGTSRVSARAFLVNALYADLIGPEAGAAAHATSTELLETRPSRWYLTGFIVPEDQRHDDTEDEEDNALGQGDDVPSDEGETSEPEPAQRRLYPASVGMSVLLPKASDGAADAVTVCVSAAQYRAEILSPNDAAGDNAIGTAADEVAGHATRRRKAWRRLPLPEQRVRVPLDRSVLSRGLRVGDWPGIWLQGHLETVPEAKALGLPVGARALSLFLVNRRSVQSTADGQSDDIEDREQASLFQVQMRLETPWPLVPTPKRRGQAAGESLDEHALELQYRHRHEYAVGHHIAVEHLADSEGQIRAVRSRWLPQAEVLPVDAPGLDGVTLSMEALAELAQAGPPCNRNCRNDASDGASDHGGEALRQALSGLPQAYRDWLVEQAQLSLPSASQRATRDELLRRAAQACRRIESGIARLATDPMARLAFALSNRAMAMAARQRSPERYADGAVPSWRLFQLAFVLLSIDGLCDGHHPDRELVDLIFFPTGGGKTEAYLGAVAMTLVLRRLRGQQAAHRGLGVAVLLRYTLRLLTLDQLERATTLICALELLRREQPELLGTGRFAVGLWVGRSATPNRLEDFRQQLLEHRSGRRREPPMPLGHCPWCHSGLKQAKQDPERAALEAELLPDPQRPERVRLRCKNAGACPFAVPEPEGLPLVFVDEQLYRELPSFIIATVDKFAMLPWKGEAGMLLGQVAAAALDGAVPRFYGALDDRPPKAARSLDQGLLPPELVVQDELHLITGPLGTMVGVYEGALDVLWQWPRSWQRSWPHSTDGNEGAGEDVGEQSGRTIRPKIIAATATAHHAALQIRALYGRDSCLFPPPATRALETFFSTVSAEAPGRLYLGVAAPGRPLKRILRDVYVALLCAAQKLATDGSYPQELSDAYLTLVGYFNALRELGGMRRLVEDDVRSRAQQKLRRRPVDAVGPSPWFAARRVHEPLELTSRRSTGDIAADKARLAAAHAASGNTDVLLASNMIAVGVDIERLGLMVVAGQPKTTSEYIQATSRVGRDRQRPGLVVTCYNVTRPRDRSYFERFLAYHQSFYRFVEAQSVTPHAARARDRGLSGALIAALRHGCPNLTSPRAAMELAAHRPTAERLADLLLSRAESAGARDGEALHAAIHHRLDHWQRQADTARSEGSAPLAYSPYDSGHRKDRHLLRDALEGREPATPSGQATAGTADTRNHALFRAPTSMRDVEPVVHLWLVDEGRYR